MLVTFCNTLVTNLMMHLYLKPRLHWLTAIPLFTTIIFMFMAIIISIGWLRFMTIWFTIQKMYSKIYSILSANTHHVSIFGGHPYQLKGTKICLGSTLCASKTIFSNVINFEEGYLCENPCWLKFWCYWLPLLRPLFENSCYSFWSNFSYFCSLWSTDFR